MIGKNWSCHFTDSSLYCQGCTLGEQTMLSKKHLQDVCLLYSGDSRRCRFLTQDEHDFLKWHCLKLTSRRSDIDVEVSDFIKDARRKGQDPTKSHLPLGDNCGGYPVMKHIQQGYDVP